MLKKFFKCLYKSLCLSLLLTTFFLSFGLPLWLTFNNQNIYYLLLYAFTAPFGITCLSTFIDYV